MKISVILKGTPDSQGRQRIVIRTTTGKTRSFKATEMRVLPKQFKDGKVVSHPQATVFNQMIKRLVVDTENNAIAVESGAVTPFHDYTAAQLKIWARTKKPETIRSYTNDAEKIKAFDPDLTLQAITLAWLERYRGHLHDIGNCTNTQWKAFKLIRKIVLAGIKEGLIKENPLKLFDGPKYRDPMRKYLTRSQVNAIEKFARETPSKELAFCAAWFVLSCYTGLRISDMKAFNQETNIRENRLVVCTTKTGEVVSMPVSSKLRSLFEFVNWQRMHYTNQTYNGYLKGIAAVCGITVNITAHLARHTAAVMWADAGMSEEVVAKLLAHSNLRSVRVYFKITNARIDAELKKME